MHADVVWADRRTFVARSGSGHAIVLDTNRENGGDASAPSPMELLLMAAGGCSSVDVVMILEKMRQHVTDCRVALDAERADTDPKVFTKITMRFQVTGRDLDRRAVERAVKLSAEKYCSVTIMLAPSVEIVREVVVLDEAATPAAV